MRTLLLCLALAGCATTTDDIAEINRLASLAQQAHLQGRMSIEKYSFVRRTLYAARNGVEASQKPGSDVALDEARRVIKAADSAIK